MLVRLFTSTQVWWMERRNERGATAIEYALLLALIAAVIIVAVVALGSKASSTYQCVNDRIVAKSGSC